MNPWTLEALRASIAKWERNAQMTNPEEMLTNADDCPLCALFHADDCEGCPVAERTEQDFCVGTPYHVVIDGDLSGFTRVAAAQAEVAFLRSLLPEGEA